MAGPLSGSLLKVALAAGLLLVAGVAVAAVREGSRRSPAGALPPAPRGWPATLALGVDNDLGQAPALAGSPALRVRYRYLSGGANTGRGWTSWGEGNGSYITAYLAESAAARILPVFVYYQLLQSRAPAPAAAGDEAARDLARLRDRGVMRAYLADLRRFLMLAGGGDRSPVVFNLEPDLWGYVQQHARRDDASTVPARVGSSGLSELRGLPDTASGLARAVVRLRDRYAPNVLLGYALSAFGTGKDIQRSRPTRSETIALAARSARFARSLRARFDLAFAEFTNRDAGYQQVVEQAGRDVEWTAADFTRYASYLRAFATRSRLRVALWQIPLGNTLMRAMNNRPGHYQDNKVQSLLGPRSQARLRQYVRAGVIGLLFGRALPAATCACDAAADGVTNPPPINGNRMPSLNADDDGGYFRARVGAFGRRAATILPPASGGRAAALRGVAARQQQVNADEGERRGEQDSGGDQHGTGSWDSGKRGHGDDRAVVTAGTATVLATGQTSDREGPA